MTTGDFSARLEGSIGCFSTTASKSGKNHCKTSGMQQKRERQFKQCKAASNKHACMHRSTTNVALHATHVVVDPTKKLFVPSNTAQGIINTDQIHTGAKGTNRSSDAVREQCKGGTCFNSTAMHVCMMLPHTGALLARNKSLNHGTSYCNTNVCCVYIAASKQAMKQTQARPRRPTPWRERTTSWLWCSQ